MTIRNAWLRLLGWPLAIFVAFTFLWYEQYKLTGNEGSVWLFSTLADWIGIGSANEKPFRLFVASLEITASVLIVLPWTRVWGAILALGIISGAIFFHAFSPLGFDPYEDGGTLFREALGVWLASAFILFAHRDELARIAARFGVRVEPAIA